MPSGPDVELHSVPGASDVRLHLGKLTADAGLVGLHRLGRQRKHLSLAGRPAEMGADIFVSIKIAIVTKHSDLDAVDVEDFASRIAE
jgi:hypothetical protein